MIVRVGVRFDVDRATPSSPLHDALEALRVVELDTSSVELGEHYADLIRRALEFAGS